MLDKEAKEILKDMGDTLRAIGEGSQEPEDARYGICHIIASKLDFYDYESIFKGESSKNSRLRRYFQSWPEFSGNAWYPVPSPVEHMSAAAYYSQIRGCGNFWEGEYGASRRRLCIHVANCIDKGLEEMK